MIKCIYDGSIANWFMIDPKSNLISCCNYCYEILLARFPNTFKEITRDQYLKYQVLK